MKSIVELENNGQKYETTYWKWLEPYTFPIKTREFSRHGKMEKLRFDEYCVLQCRKLNDENPDDTYIVAYKPRPERTEGKSYVYQITVVKLIEED